MQSRIETAKQRLEKIKQWKYMKSQSCIEDKKISEILNISRSTFFEWQRQYKEFGLTGLVPKSKRPKKLRAQVITQELIDLVLKIRKNCPIYGKGKIFAILKRSSSLKSSESTVGRILKNLKDNGLICKVYYLAKEKKKRKFNKHAKRFTYGMKAKRPGQLVQIDHMTVSNALVNNAVKHFAGVDPTTKYLSAQVYSNAKSSTAAKFLDQLIDEFPFPIESIQVDGGSEFMADFEEACEERGIELYVLPPKKPKWNGCVERSNKTFRNEFYDCNDKLRSIHSLRKSLQEFVAHYNTFRAHFSLKYETPICYYYSVSKEAA
jgi:transposase